MVSVKGQAFSRAAMFAATEISVSQPIHFLLEDEDVGREVIIPTKAPYDTRISNEYQARRIC
jgi:hypothetical protein